MTLNSKISTHFFSKLHTIIPTSPVSNTNYGKNVSRNSNRNSILSKSSTNLKHKNQFFFLWTLSVEMIVVQCSMSKFIILIKSMNKFFCSLFGHCLYYPVPKKDYIYIHFPINFLTKSKKLFWCSICNKQHYLTIICLVFFLSLN